MRRNNMEWAQLLSTTRNRSNTGKSVDGRMGVHDLRSEFERDYHRIIGSASFRRLQDKTQVFPLDKSDFIRTRLTHSLEVSSFAKALGQNIAQYMLDNHKDPSFTLQMKYDMCDVLQCAGLIHDIGNPPFGHFGETAMREWFERNLSTIHYNGKPIPEYLTPQMLQDFYHFEGNAQVLRVVSKLHYLSDENGMNLTYALLGTIMKYPGSSLEINPDSDDIAKKKMGYFYAERDLVAKIQKVTGTNGKRHPLSFILEAADDIAYKTADIEDAVKKGCLSYQQLMRELEELTMISTPENEFYFSPVKELRQCYNKAIAKRLKDPELYAVQNWLVRVQGHLLRCATYAFTRNYDMIMKGQYTRDLFYNTYAQELMDALGDIAYRYAFVTNEIYRLEIGAGTVLNFLLTNFVRAVVLYDTDATLGTIDEKLVAIISDNYKNLYHREAKGKSEEEKLYMRLMLVTDSVCGMTDSYAKELYQELNGIL